MMSVILLFLPTPVSFGNIIDDIILKQKQKQWHVGDNLSSGDSFTYRICDENTFTKSNFAEKCYIIKISFYDIFDGPLGKTWVAQSLILSDKFTRPAIFQIDASTFNITTDSSNLEFARSVENTLFSIRKFANPTSPQILQVGQSWGTIPSYLTTDSDVMVLNENVVKIDKKEFKVFTVGYNLKKQSAYDISKQFPFPLRGQVYSSTVIYPEPDFLFSFDLLKYGFGALENNILEVHSVGNADGIVPINNKGINHDSLVCIPDESLKFNSTWLIDDSGMTKLEWQTYLDNVGSEIAHETFIHSIDGIFEH